jgi:hypothetical protein
MSREFPSPTGSAPRLQLFTDHESLITGELGYIPTESAEDTESRVASPSLLPFH